MRKLLLLLFFPSVTNWSDIMLFARVVGVLV